MTDFWFNFFESSVWQHTSTGPDVAKSTNISTYLAKSTNTSTCLSPAVAKSTSKKYF